MTMSALAILVTDWPRSTHDARSVTGGTVPLVASVGTTGGVTANPDHVTLPLASMSRLVCPDNTALVPPWLASTVQDPSPGTLDTASSVVQSVRYTAAAPPATVLVKESSADTEGIGVLKRA